MAEIALRCRRLLGMFESPWKCWALTPDGGHGICGYAASGSVAGAWVLS